MSLSAPLDFGLPSDRGGKDIGVFLPMASQENAFVASARSSFMTPRLIGSPETVADQAIALMEQAELDGLMLIFPDYIEGLWILADRVLPKIRAHFSPAQEAMSLAL